MSVASQGDGGMVLVFDVGLNFSLGHLAKKHKNYMQSNIFTYESILEDNYMCYGSSKCVKQCYM